MSVLHESAWAFGGMVRAHQGIWRSCTPNRIGAVLAQSCVPGDVPAFAPVVYGRSALLHSFPTDATNQYVIDDVVPVMSDVIFSKYRTLQR
eukprot:6213907-Pleurochrysis_carterae.AAC.1